MESLSGSRQIHRLTVCRGGLVESWVESFGRQGLPDLPCVRAEFGALFSGTESPLSIFKGSFSLLGDAGSGTSPAAAKNSISSADGPRVNETRRDAPGCDGTLLNLTDGQPNGCRRQGLTRMRGLKVVDPGRIIDYRHSR